VSADAEGDGEIVLGVSAASAITHKHADDVRAWHGDDEEEKEPVAH